MSTFFTSDPHYEHVNIIKYCDRPFRDVDHMREELISRYNSRVGVEDECYWLGDAFFRVKREGYRNTQTMSRLNGKKYLVKGNHDTLSQQAYVEMGFSEVHSEMEIELGGEIVLLKHHPIYEGTTFPVRQANRKQMHGHTHSKERRQGHLLHVGVDAWEYAPVSEEEVVALMYTVGLLPEN